MKDLSFLALMSLHNYYLRLKEILHEALLTFRESGLKGLFKKYGWKIFLIFFMYYLIRDLILYVFLPYFAYKLVF